MFARVSEFEIALWGRMPSCARLPIALAGSKNRFGRRVGNPAQVRQPAPLFIAICITAVCHAQNLPRLTLQEAQAMALQNHPQIAAAQNEVNYANQQIAVERSGYYPNVNADITGSQGNNLARIGAGDLPASRLFNRFGQGVIVRQLITDSGRTPALVASSRLGAQAAGQTAQATRYEVLLGVNRAYYDVLRAQATVRVAEQTVAARQLLSDQVTELARNNLRSQLDVSFADVNVSEAKLLLLRAQDSVQEAQAELGRALGSDQPANYQLIDEPLPSAPPAAPNDLVAQAAGNRPELASLRLARDSAYKFYEAEKDLSRPAVSAVAVGGFLPYINSSGVPAEYEGIAANVNFPIFNGHLFSARREAALQRAMQADQRLRDQQEIIARDVRVAWAAANDAYQRIDVTAQFLRQASLGLDLAQGRYQLGLASIVELTQGQLSLTQAEIENLTAKYDYQTQNSVLQFTLGLLR
ncbi:MAG: TolC family protein [Bryobacterales bacterium]|nr:TolC family protein [Bryobacterales bacterium]MBV9397920.1 TolC family protein [Bryobacterales bacterium]